MRACVYACFPCHSPLLIPLRDNSRIILLKATLQHYKGLSKTAFILNKAVGNSNSIVFDHRPQLPSQRNVFLSVTLYAVFKLPKQKGIELCRLCLSGKHYFATHREVSVKQQVDWVGHSCHQTKEHSWCHMAYYNNWVSGLIRVNAPNKLFWK